MDELLAQFLIEGPELVEQAVEALLALEQRPGDRAPIDDAFRAVHTLKGGVGLFDLPAMATVLHTAEDVLSAMRGGSGPIDAATIGRLLATLDQVQAWLRSSALTRLSFAIRNRTCAARSPDFCLSLRPSAT